MIIRRIVVFGGVAAIVIAGAVTALALYLHGRTPASLADKQPLASLPKKSGSAVNLSRVAPNVMPPTNSWLSGAVLQKTPDAVYPMPLSFLPKDTGFEISLPTITAQATVITGEHTPDVPVTIADATTFQLTRYDKISATLSYRSGTSTLGTLTLAEGSPFVFYRSKNTTNLRVMNVMATENNSSSYMRFKVGAHSYAIAAYDSAKLDFQNGSIAITAPKGSLVTFYGLPDASGDPLHDIAANELDSVKTAWSNNMSNATTTLTYHTVNGKATAIVPMAYSKTVSSENKLGTYASLYGTMTAQKGPAVTLEAPKVAPANKLDLSHLSSADKAVLTSQLHSDITATSIIAKDSYNAGKQLARAANLLQIAESLGQKDEAKQLIAMLSSAFDSRLTAQYFYYDTDLHGIVANQIGFGAEDFNDHHFHYGYWLYAASILGSYDKSFVAKNADLLNLLAADIASYQSSADFPATRYYDAYAQHSWAAGLAPFSDGNNQESSSEALNAWNGVALWGQLTGNRELASTAKWMLAGEAHTAQVAWRQPSSTLQTSYLKGYNSSVSSLNFGGKRTYNTFFSDEASAKLGIQLIPLSPAMTVFKNDKDIQKTVTASVNDNFNQPLGDYDLMYLALASPSEARSLLTQQTQIDDGNSKTYIEAWIYSLSDS